MALAFFWCGSACLQHVWIALLIWSHSDCFPQRNAREHDRKPDGFRFPVVYNATGRSLPVFPERHAPAVDKEGNPLCRKNPEDTFCEKVDDYPGDLVMKSVPYSAKDFRDIFGGTRRSSLTRKARPGDPTETPVCPQRTRVFFPKAAENDNGDWSFIVNGNDVEEEYVQAVVAELCETKDKECNYLDGTLPHGMTSRCMQKYAYKRLLALHPEERRTHTDSFKFPSCCVCMVSKPYLSAAGTLFRSRAPDDKTAIS